MMQHSRVLTLLALLLAAVPARAQPSEIVRSWNFAVSLDGDLIGTHRFDLRQAGPSLAMRGHADFAVKFLGLTLYRYRHEVTSRWQDACLDNLSAQTDDDGAKTSGSATASATATRVIRRRDGSGESELTVSGCMMDFAYWNPNLLTQTRLLNPQTGEIEAVQIIAGRTGADNPLTKVKVRQAIAHAINRAEMAKNLMKGGSRQIDTPCFPTQFGCDQAAAVRYDFDPAKAKALLAEAGYPNGFETELVTFLLPQFGAAVQNYLAAVGIKAKISQLQVSALIQRGIEGTLPLSLTNWGSYSINDASAFLPAIVNGGSQDHIRNPDLQKLVEAGGSSINPDDRRKNYSAAIKMMTENVYMLPLFNSVVTYGVSKQLNFKSYPDELPRFYMATWK